MNGGLDIARAIAELGVLVVIAGIFLYFDIKARNKEQSMFDTMFKSILQQMKICAGGHVLTEEEDKTAIKIDTAINTLIQKAVGDLKASRIMVVRYHNGGRDMNSISFLKLSVTNESVTHGCTPVMSEFQNQFRSIVGHPVKEIEVSGYSYVEDIEDIKNIDIGTYELLKSRGVRSYYAHKLTNATGYVIGAILVTYRLENKVKEDPNTIHQYLPHLADRISGLLNAKEE